MFLSLFTLAISRNLEMRSPGTATVLNPAGDDAEGLRDLSGTEGSVALVMMEEGLGPGTGLVALS